MAVTQRPAPVAQEAQAVAVQVMAHTVLRPLAQSIPGAGAVEPTSTVTPVVVLAAAES